MRKNLLVLAACLSMYAPVSVMAASTEANVTEAAKTVSNEPAVGAIQDAMKQFRNLSRAERKDRIHQAKDYLKQIKAQKATAPALENTFLLVLITILLPPLGVYLHQGEINSKFSISLILTLLFYIPGLIYSLIVVLG